MSDYWQELQDAFEELCVLAPAERGRILDQRAFSDEQESGQAWRWYGLQLGERGGYVSMNPGDSRRYLEKSAAELEAALKLDPSNPRTIWLLANTRETLA